MLFICYVKEYVNTKMRIRYNELNMKLDANNDYEDNGIIIVTCPIYNERIAPSNGTTC